jgi:hypothetical protein
MVLLKWLLALFAEFYCHVFIQSLARIFIVAGCGSIRVLPGQTGVGK